MKRTIPQLATVCLLAMFAAAATGQATSASMTPAQRAEFDAAGKLFNEGDSAAALAKLKPLHDQLPGNTLITKFASEAAVDTGDAAYAIAQCKPLEAADPKDWQAAGILAHAYAEAGDKPARDAEIAHLRQLHSTLGEPFASRRDFLLETLRDGDKVIRFFPALTPWGPYKVQVIARVYDAQGQQIMRVTLESSDGDQQYFAKTHPEEAAKGIRQYTLDGYGPERTENGQKVVTHFTFGFFTGDPGYDAFRQDVLEIVSGKRAPISSQTTAAE